MKTSLITSAIALAALTILALSSCAHLAGTTLSFDEHGNAVIQSPERPIVIQARK